MRPQRKLDEINSCVMALYHILQVDSKACLKQYRIMVEDREKTFRGVTDVSPARYRPPLTLVQEAAGYLLRSPIFSLLSQHRLPRLGLELADAAQLRGVTVTRIQPDGIAHRSASLEVGDLISAVDSHLIRDRVEFEYAMKLAVAREANSAGGADGTSSSQLSAVVSLSTQRGVLFLKVPLQGR